MSKYSKKIPLLFIGTFIIIIFMIHNNKKQESITYLTSVAEINNILNDSAKTFKILSENEYVDEINFEVLNNNLVFKKKSVLVNEKSLLINYRSTNNTISILKVNVEREENVDNYIFSDEFNIPIVIFEYEKIKIVLCNNLEKSESRNFYFYDIYKNKIIPSCTRANEIIFFYKNNLYYIGFDFNLDKFQISKLINKILIITGEKI